MKTFETCLCGIAKVDCTFHKPPPEKPNFVNDHDLPGSYLILTNTGGEWIKLKYVNGRWERL